VEVATGVGADPAALLAGMHAPRVPAEGGLTLHDGTGTGYSRGNTRNDHLEV